MSRRAILSRSRDDLTMDGGDKLETEEEDVWFVKEKLYKVGDVGLLRKIKYKGNLSLINI